MHREIADYVLECVANALEAGATHVRLRLRQSEERISVVVEDNGCGMTAAEAEAATDPFFSAAGKHPNRRVGLGLAFLAQATESCGGSLEVESAPGRGTRVTFTFRLDHLDCPPMADVAGCLLHVLCLAGDHELEVERTLGDRSYRVRRSQVREALGGLETVGELLLMREYLESQEAALATVTAAGDRQEGVKT